MAYAKSTDTQRKLVQSTAHLLRTRGYAGTGLSAIVDASGVPKGSLYHHFPGGKEALAAAALEAAREQIVGTLAGLIDRAAGLPEAVEAFCDHYAEQLEASGFGAGCPLATVTLEAAGVGAPVQAACGEAFAAINGLLAERLAQAGLDAEAAERTAVFVTASVEGALMLAKASRDTRNLRVVRDQLADYLRRALREAA